MIFDGNVLFGFDGAQNLPMDASSVLTRMDRAGIDRALLTNTRCMHGDFMLGNQETLEVVRSSPDRFIGMAGFSMTQYLDVAATVHNAIAQREFAGIRFFNTDSSFMSGWGSSFDTLGMRSVLNQIRGTGMLAFLEGGYAFGQIAELCGRYPDIPFIASGTGYVNLSEAVLALLAAPNLYLDLSTLDAFQGVETLVSRMGAHRLLFGTCLPYNCPSCIKLLVEKADISSADKRKIFAENLQELVERRQRI